MLLLQEDEEMRASKTRLITELEQEKQRLEMEVHKMQKSKETKAATKIPAGNMVLTSLFNYQSLF